MGYLIVFKKQMLREADPDLFNPLAPKAHNMQQWVLKSTISITS